MTETMQRYHRIAGGFNTTVNAASAENWNAPSPCSEWSARDVVGHVVGNHRWLVATVRGSEPQGLGDGEDPAEAWRTVYGEILGIGDDPTALATVIEGPMGKMPFEQMLGSFVCMDVLIHTWDLARAVGADDRLDEASVADAYETMKPLDEAIRQPGFFGPRLEAPSGADLQTEFLYFLGRRT
jgi:uncharacterized protein (TIGR03086 family)